MHHFDICLLRVQLCYLRSLLPVGTYYHDGCDWVLQSITAAVVLSCPLSSLSRALLFLLPEEVGFLRYLRAAKVCMLLFGMYSGLLYLSAITRAPLCCTTGLAAVSGTPSGQLWRLCIDIP